MLWINKKLPHWVAGKRSMYKHRTPRQLSLAAPYQFPDMTQQRGAERGVQYLC